MQVVFEDTCELNECKSSLNTALSVGDKQLHVSAICSHLQTEYRFTIGEKHSSSLNYIFFSY
jgi:hypothetical protein